MIGTDGKSERSVEEAPKESGVVNNSGHQSAGVHQFTQNCNQMSDLPRMVRLSVHHSSLPISQTNFNLMSRHQETTTKPFYHAIPHAI